MESLEAVVYSLINEDTASAKAAFHDYLQTKSQQVLTTERYEDEYPDYDDDSDPIGFDPMDDDDEVEGEDDPDAEMDREGNSPSRSNKPYRDQSWR